MHVWIYVQFMRFPQHVNPTSFWGLHLDGTTRGILTEPTQLLWGPTIFLDPFKVDRVKKSKIFELDVIVDLFNIWMHVLDICCNIPCKIHPKSTQVPGLCHVSWQEITFIEFFAGQGNVWRMMRCDGINSIGLDIEYWKKPGPGGHRDDLHNPYDILSDSGLA